MDELKKYLQNHRGDLDNDLPGDGVWTSIREELHPTPAKTFSIKAKWLIAACFILLAGTGAYLLTREDNTVSTGLAINNDHVIEPFAFTPRSVTTPEKEQLPLTKKDVPIVKPSTKRTPVANDVNKIPSEPKYGFEDIEYSYASMLDMQLARIRKQPIYAESADYFSLFKKQFSDLENHESQVKRSIRQTGMTDERLNMLINIFQQKISVLKELQFEINKMNNRVKQINPGVQQKHPTYMNI